MIFLYKNMTFFWNDDDINYYFDPITSKNQGQHYDYYQYGITF